MGSLIVLAVLGGCDKRPQSRTGAVRQLKKSELTPAERKYGVAPVPDPAVSYQPAVVMVGGGADAIRARSSDGLTWTIDGSAPHANEIAEGRIVFVTDLAVGRVLDVRRSDRDLLVTIGPVLITDVIKDCDIQPGPIPIDFDDAVPNEVLDLPGRVIPGKTADARPVDGAVITPVSYQPPGAEPAAPAPDVSHLVNFTLVPSAGSDGIGLKGTSDGGGMKMTVAALIHLRAPAFTPRLTIVNGYLKEGSLALSGAAGLTLKFEAGTDVGMKANVNARMQAVPDFVLHIAGTPTVLTVRQQIIVKTALGVRNSTLGATGDYTFSGEFKVGYSDKGWALYGPNDFTAKHSLLQSLNGISMGPAGLNLIHEMKVMFGLGAGGFATGPYFGLNSSLGLFKGSDLGMIPCKEATVHVGMSGGIGYLTPKPVTDVINFVLGKLQIKYRVDSFGGIESKPMDIITKTTTLPGCEAGKE